MGAWGIGPLENDNAADVAAAVVRELARTLDAFVAFTELRQRGDRDALVAAVDEGAPGLDVARAAIAVLRLLLRNGVASLADYDVQRWTAAIDAWPAPTMFEPHVEAAFPRLLRREVDELVALADDARETTNATTATWPQPCSAVERALFDVHAPAELVAWAADLASVDAAWQACRVAEWMPYLAALRGTALSDVVATVARMIADAGADDRARLESSLHGTNNRITRGPTWHSCAYVLRMLGRAAHDSHAERERWEAEMADRMRRALS